MNYIPKNGKFSKGEDEKMFTFTSAPHIPFQPTILTYFMYTETSILFVHETSILFKYVQTVNSTILHVEWTGIEQNRIEYKPHTRQQHVESTPVKIQRLKKGNEVKMQY